MPPTLGDEVVESLKLVSVEKTRLGLVKMVSVNSILHAAEFLDDPSSIKPSEKSNPFHERIARIMDGEEKISVPVYLRPSGTEFQYLVWNALMEIPMGTTISYQDLAFNLGAPRSARAVGAAIGKNKIALLIPCHRVVRADGGTGGFRWGMDRKEALLKWERRRLGSAPGLI